MIVESGRPTSNSLGCVAKRKFRQPVAADEFAAEVDERDEGGQLASHVNTVMVSTVIT